MTSSSDPHSGRALPALAAKSLTRVAWLLVATALLAIVAAAGLFWMATNRIEPIRPTRGERVTKSSAPLAESLARAESGDVRSQLEVAHRFADGREIPRNYVSAARWFRAAADQGDAEAQAGLAELYEAGQGVPLDYSEAAKWYRRAAEQGHAGAQFGLAVLHEFGRGVNRDQAGAASWYQRAAEQGEAEAQYNLAQRYSAGVGVPADLMQASKWFQLAALRGVADASRAADECRARLSPAQRSEVDAAVGAFAAGRDRDPAGTRRER